MRKILLAGVASTTLCAVTGPVMADSLTPSTFSATIPLGGSTTVNKVGVISKGTPTTAQADVFFVVDSTGSMGPGITTLTNALASTATQLSGLGTFKFGVADYKDQTAGGDAYNYTQRLNIPGTAAQAGTALGTVAGIVGGGGDDPEQGLFALQQAATTTSWDAGSKRIAVIVGDAPSHSSAVAGRGPAAGGATVANTATKLNANGVTMIALDAHGVTGNASGLNQLNQFSGAGSLLAAGVTGSFGAFTNATDLANQIVADVGSAFASYSDVSLDLIGPAPSCVSVSLPADIVGSFDRSVDRTFTFNPMGITGTSIGSCGFTIALEADGAVLATETDTITVTAAKAPEPTSMAMLGVGLLGLGGVIRRRRKSG